MRALALIFLFVGIVFSFQAPADHPLTSSPLEKMPPCHRHHSPAQAPAGHQCCRDGQTSVVVNTVREDAPTNVVLSSNVTSDELSRPAVSLVRMDRVQLGDPPVLSSLRI